MGKKSSLHGFVYETLVINRYPQNLPLSLSLLQIIGRTTTSPEIAFIFTQNLRFTTKFVTDGLHLQHFYDALLSSKSQEAEEGILLQILQKNPTPGKAIILNLESKVNTIRRDHHISFAF